MELTREQIEAAQAKINADIQELDFEETPIQSADKSITHFEEAEPTRSDLLQQEMDNQQNFIPATISAKVGVSAELIKDLEAEYKGLIVTSAKDKDGIQVLKDALTRVKTIKRNIESTREDLKRPILEAGRALDAEAKQLTASIDVVLKPLAELQVKVDKMIDDERFAVQRAQEKVMNERVEILKQKGAVQEGVFYCVGQSISITPDVLKTMEPEDFNNLLAKVEKAIEAETARKAKEEEEKAGLQADREAIEKQKQALLDGRVSMREAMIKMLGYMPKDVNPGIFDLVSEEFPDVKANITYDHLSQYDDAAFMKYLEENKARFDAVVKGRRALKLKDDRLKERGKILQNHGLTWDFTKDRWSYDNGRVVAYRATIYDLDDETFGKIAFELQDAIVKHELKKVADDQAAQDRIKLEEETRANNRVTYLPSLIALKAILVQFESDYGNLFELYPDKVMERIDQLSMCLSAEINPQIETEDQEEEDDQDENDLETGMYFEQHM